MSTSIVLGTRYAIILSGVVEHTEVSNY